jgi:hypothetical protein
MKPAFCIDGSLGVAEALAQRKESPRPLCIAAASGLSKRKDGTAASMRPTPRTWGSRGFARALELSFQRKMRTAAAMKPAFGTKGSLGFAGALDSAKGKVSRLLSMKLDFPVSGEVLASLGASGLSFRQQKLNLIHAQSARKAGTNVPPHAAYGKSCMFSHGGRSSGIGGESDRLSYCVKVCDRPSSRLAGWGRIQQLAAGAL